MRAPILILTAAVSAAAQQPGRYLDVVRSFVETMMAKGTDRYGSVHSPLFASMLNLETMSLFDIRVDDLLRDSGPQVRALGHGIPDPPAGIRPGDRAPLGNNLEHDIMLLRVMYELSAVTGDSKYADQARAILRFWLLNCQSPATGLMASGEHMSWNFLHEKAYGDVHEVFRRFPFFEQLYSVDPYRALGIADGMWMAQIGEKKHGDFSRHAGYHSYRASVGGAPDVAFPRHAGFYIWTYANAYVESRDPKFIERAEVLIESRTSLRMQPWSLIVQPGGFRPVHSVDPAMRILLWDAAELVPARKEAWQKAVRQLDERALVEARLSRPRRGLWEMAYGDAGVSGTALEHFTHYLQSGDERFLRLAEQIADAYVAEGWPASTGSLWPKAPGQVISLLVSLSGEPRIAKDKQKRYREFAVLAADRSISLFSRNGLFRADGQARHYEAITGADDLVYSLLQLYCALAKPELKLTHIDVNL
ncbi:MAG: hypothetical protein HY235_04280 [Acidobacteria bacterium]|nr:hypothetical protein [Acidobacteriota bacterium]